MTIKHSDTIRAAWKSGLFLCFWENKTKSLKKVEYIEFDEGTHRRVIVNHLIYCLISEQRAKHVLFHILSSFFFIFCFFSSEERHIAWNTYQKHAKVDVTQKISNKKNWFKF